MTQHYTLLRKQMSTKEANKSHTASPIETSLSSEPDNLDSELEKRAFHYR